MENTLSKRMRAVADLVQQVEIACDVGCDHGYISIYLVRNEICKRMLAMDVRKGPLSQAKENIRLAGLEGQIETRLSDGLHEVTPGECDAVVIAGMGGKLMIRILEEGMDVVKHCKYLVMQPQSDLAFVRSYLYEHGFSIEAEDMVLEDGKFYPMMRVIRKTPEKLQGDRRHQEYGPLLLESGHPVLRQFLEKKAQTLCQIKEKLLEHDKNHPKLVEIEKEYAEILETITFVIEKGCK